MTRIFISKNIIIWIHLQFISTTSFQILFTESNNDDDNNDDIYIYIYSKVRLSRMRLGPRYTVAYERNVTVAYENS